MKFYPRNWAIEEVRDGEACKREACQYTTLTCVKKNCQRYSRNASSKIG